MTGATELHEAGPADPPGIVRLTDGLGLVTERESVDDALMIVASYGPWGADLNDAHRRQIVLAEEVLRLRGLYEMAVGGRAEMRTALRLAREGFAREAATGLPVLPQWANGADPLYTCADLQAAMAAERERCAAVARRWGDTHAEGETVNARNAASKIARGIEGPNVRAKPAKLGLSEGLASTRTNAGMQL